MGTNYNTLIGQHVGKLVMKKTFMSGYKYPEPVFMWAADPRAIETLCANFWAQVCIRDEYGKDYTGQMFAEQIVHRASSDTTLMGQEFS